MTAAWVVYDNDGLPDLYTFPQGLFRQRPNHTFEPTGLLAFDDEFDATIANWFYMDNDGRRDLLLAVARNRDYRPWRWTGASYSAVPAGWQVLAFRNRGAANHWLEVRVEGPDGNRQAIGTCVRVATASRSQTQHVGSAEGSFFSQGHCRLYFGLGRHEAADVVTVRWPDGCELEFRNVRGDRISVISTDVSRSL